MDCRNATEYLRDVGHMVDEDVDLAAAALALANLSRPDTDPGPYRIHLDALVQDVTRAAAGTLDPLNPGLAGRIAALNTVIIDRHVLSRRPRHL